MGVFDSIYKNVKTLISGELNLKTNYPETNDCVELDKQLKQLDIAINDARRAEIQANKDIDKFKSRAKAELMEEVRSKKQTQFIEKKCATNLENMKAQETAKIIGQEVSKYEEDVLGGSDKERQKLFIIGGVILLFALGTILILTKNNK